MRHGSGDIMASSIFGAAQQPPASFPTGEIASLARRVRESGSVCAYAEAMARGNPAFAQFLQATRGQSVDQIAQAMGVDIGALRGLL